MTLTPMATAPAASGPASTDRPVRQRLTMQERRQAWARHREAMTRLVTGKIDWVPVLVFASILMSPEARIDLGGFQLYPYRLALIASLPFMLIEAGRRPLRLALTDVLMVSGAALMFIATALHYSLDVTLKTGGSNTLDVLAAYFLGRTFFRNALDLRRFLFRVSPLLIIIAIIMGLESVSHRYLMRPIIGSLTGHSPAVALARFYELRMGLLRATGPFLHPIAAGIFFGSLVPLYVMADLPKWRWIGLIACFGGIFGWSSTGMVAIAAGLGLCAYDSFQKRARLGWMPLVLAVLVACIVIQAFSQGGLVKFIIRYAALNPQTGYFRLLIWEYGWASVDKSPWTGIGYFSTYERPKWMHSDSVDNFWLLHSMRYGVPSMALILAGVLAAVITLARSKQGFELGALYARRLATGLCISLTVIFVSLLTASPWGADLAWLIALVGIAVGMTDRGAIKT